MTTETRYQPGHQRGAETRGVDPVSDTELDDHIEAAERVLASALAHRPLIAYSGGKDSIVVADLAARAGVREGACEISFCFDAFIEDTRAIADRLGLAVEYSEVVNLGWLRRYAERVLFVDDAHWRGWMFARRQHHALDLAARAGGHGGILTGRRTEENTVPGHVYRRANGLVMAHPIRDWKLRHVWAYFDRRGWPTPWIYGNAFGAINGSGPFYSARPVDYGGREECWRLVEDLDPRFTRARLGLE